MKKIFRITESQLINLIKQQLNEDENLADYNEELNFAKDLIAGKVKFENFPYYNDYVETLNTEQSHINGSVLFIGSGPLPLSIILLKQKGHRVDGMDYSSEGIKYGKEVLNGVGMNDVRLFYSDASKFKGYRNYNTIILSLEAGVNLDTKNKIFNNIYNQIKDNTIILVRSSNQENLDGSFVNSSSIMNNYFDEIDSVKIFGGLSTTHVLKKKTSEELTEVDNIKGGKSDNKDISDIAKLHNVSIEHLNNELKIGIPTEYEHTKSKKLAQEIAFDHLIENPNYYTILNKTGLVD